ncbi:MAG: hypothetical protein OXD32_00120, partial [Endozoicomonadaceae bacterium]|nr:hypothetical protein [Endozoicomonadaceae bacterium]
MGAISSKTDSYVRLPSEPVRESQRSNNQGKTNNNRTVKFSATTQPIRKDSRTTSVNAKNIYTRTVQSHQSDRVSPVVSAIPQPAPPDIEQKLDEYVQAFIQQQHTFTALAEHQYERAEDKSTKADARKKLKILTKVDSDKKFQQLFELLKKHPNPGLSRAEYQTVQKNAQWVNLQLQPLWDDFDVCPPKLDFFPVRLPDLPSPDKVSALTTQRQAATDNLSVLQQFNQTTLPKYQNSLSLLQLSESYHGSKKDAVIALQKLQHIENSAQVVELATLLSDIASKQVPASKKNLKQIQENVAWINQQLKPALKLLHGNKAAAIAENQ